jgi:uroporphyrinogen decarboxylase
MRKTILIKEMPMNKRELVLSLSDERKHQTYIPAAFFIHFDKIYRSGRLAVEKHLEYFRYTGMDLIKIQFETEFPRVPEIEKPEDWGKMPFYGRDFYHDQLYIAKSLIEEGREEALVIMTLYSPFMCARSTVGGEERITAHIKEAPDKVKKGMEIITDSLMTFVKACIEIGIDGFYTSTQGGESHRFSDPIYFNTCIKPYDLLLMKEINRSCIFNILHICDFRGKYDNLTPFLDYPGHVVSYGKDLGGKESCAKDMYQMFKRPVMGGMDRKGIVVTGSAAEIRAQVLEVLREAPERFILGADCTLPDNVNWDNIRTAVAMAHAYERK